MPFCQYDLHGSIVSKDDRMATTGDTLGSGSENGPGKAWSADHSVDARYRFPWLGGPVYVRIILGRERRPDERAREHNAASIGRSLMNVLMFAMGACVIYTAAGAILLTFSSVLE